MEVVTLGNEPNGPGLLVRAWRTFIEFFVSPVLDQSDEDAADNQPLFVRIDRAIGGQWAWPRI